LALSAKTKKFCGKISSRDTKLGEIKKLGKEIKKDHDLAMELWSTGDFHPRLLATLIFDKRQLDDKAVDQIVSDLGKHNDKERDQLADWLLANQLTKDKKLVELMLTWEKNRKPMLRRLFWYYQARLRWTGKNPSPGSSAQLLDSLEANLAAEKPEVQWVMNFCAGWIGVFEPKFRSRCVKLGKATGLYQDEMVAKNCTPSYLPEFIRIEVAKRK
jgi:3-methyladenine DNA glycosylase AlkD